MTQGTAEQAAGTDATKDDAASTGTGEAAAAADGGDGDWQAKYEAQQKINRDLDKKVKADKGARDAAATEKARADALQAKLDGKEAEHTAAQEKAANDAAVLAKANDRILRSEVKAAAKGVLADPADAYKFLDLDTFEVSEDGDVDETAIKAALDDLIEKKPYLAAQGGRFQGSADGGTRKESGASIDDQIAEATKAGNHQLAIALKQRRAAEIAAKKS